MPIHIVQLGSARLPHEGLRLGTVRRPPRGVAKKDFARLNYYDLWLPILSPSPATIKLAQSTDNAAGWKRFASKYRTEMKKPEARMMLDLLATLSHQTSFSVGCYCADEAHCHRSILRQLLVERGAKLVPDYLLKEVELSRNEFREGKGKTGSVEQIMKEILYEP